jgi:UDP-N-acetylmuramyl pentapeptide phosphotransferase/UDP-N-acetylglucosamine-1-phosphate transferase
VAGAVAVAEGAGSVEVVFLPLLPAFLDASATLVRRLSRGERVWEAHRMHLYQRLANGGWGHARTAQLYAVASLLGVIMLRTGTSYRTAAIALYVIAVVGLGVWLDRRAQPAVTGAGQGAPSP